ncbi:MAG: hypothetical protein GY861_23865 [bacterium]|nr:hypothetical protein [bacterium]
MNKNKNNAQTTMEYLLLIGIVGVVLYVMGPAFQRGIQSIVKLGADQIGSQQNAEQKVTETSGYLINSTTVRSSSKEKTSRELHYSAHYDINESESVVTTTATNMGFTESTQRPIDGVIRVDADDVDGDDAAEHEDEEKKN